MTFPLQGCDAVTLTVKVTTVSSHVMVRAGRGLGSRLAIRAAAALSVSAAGPTVGCHQPVSPLTAAARRLADAPAAAFESLST